MNRKVCALAVVLLIGLSFGTTRAGDGGFNGLPLGIDLPNTSDVDFGYVRIADDDALEPQTLTIEAWIHPQGLGYGFQPTIIAKPWEGVAGNYIFSWHMLWWADTGQIWVFLTNSMPNGGIGLLSNGTVPLDNTAHVAMTFDGTWLRIFIDGQLDNQVETGFAVVDYGDQDVLIGAGNFGNGFVRRFDGIIDEVRIWDHARTDGEIAGQMDCALSGDEPGLLVYYSFNMGDATDDSLHGHDGLIEGAADYVEFYQDCMIHFDGFDGGDTGGWN